MTSTVTPNAWTWAVVRSWRRLDALLPVLVAPGALLAALFFSGVSVPGLFGAPAARPPIAAFLWFLLVVVVLHGASSHYALVRKAGVGFTLPVLFTIGFLGAAAVVMEVLEPWSGLFLATGTVGALPAMYASSHEDLAGNSVRFNLVTGVFLSGVLITVLSGSVVFLVPQGATGAPLAGGALAQVGIAVFLSAVATDVLRARRLPTTYGVVGFYGGTDVLFVVFLGTAVLCATGLAVATGGGTP